MTYNATTIKSYKFLVSLGALVKYTVLQSRRKRTKLRVSKSDTKMPRAAKITKDSIPSNRLMPAVKEKVSDLL